MPEPGPIVLLPGLGADTRMFDPLRAAGINVQTPAWIEPHPRESLAEYAARFARAIDPGPVFGGASFGGMLALEIARHLRPRTIILLGSCTTPRRLRPGATLLERASRPLPDRLLRTLMHSQIGIGRLGPMDAHTRSALHEMVCQAPLSFIRWGLRAIMTWPGVHPDSLASPLLVLHGECDRIIRPPAPTDDLRVHIVRGSGHVFPMTHPAKVAAIVSAHA